MKQGWEIRKLGEVCVTGAGGTPLKTHKDYYEGGNIPWILSGEVSQGEIFEAKNYITEKGLKNSSAKLFPPDTVLVAMYGATAGQVGILRFEAATNQAVCGILPNSKSIPEYLFYCFLSKKDELVAQAVGGAQPNISQIKIKNTKIPLPPLPEQQRIVSILDEAFSAIERSRNNAEQNLKNARELFDCVLDSILHDKKWKIEQLGNLCEKVEYGTSSKAKSEGELPVLRMGNIQNGRFIWDSLVYSDNEEDNKQYLLRHNDILFNRTNSPELVGKTAIYKSEQPAIFAGYLIRIHRKDNILDADFLNYYLNSKMAFDYGKTVVISSVNQANINGTKLKTYPIPLPSLQEQQTIVRQLDVLRAETQKLETIYQNKLINLEELKKSILQKAFAGELRTEKAIAV